MATATRTILILSAAAGLFFASPQSPLFEQTGAESGLDFRHFNGMSGRFFIVENMGSGCGLLDFDNDGDLDLYLVQGGELTGSLPNPAPGDRLYRNDPSDNPPRRFTDVTSRAGLGRGGYGMGVASGDFDNDGWTDLYITAWGANRLLRNNRDGSFRDVTEASKTQDQGWSVPAVFFDYDRDGWLDLYVGNYVQYRLEAERECRTPAGARDYCNPAAYPASPDRLFHNRGGGTFEDATRRSGLQNAAPGRALGAVAEDFDGDGWPDLYVANDGGPNHLWINQGDGTFREDALLAGCAVNDVGRSEASMGVEAADLDGDGDIDIFLSHLTGETHTLYLNEGQGAFADATQSADLGPPTQWSTGFGTGAIDYDNDGWLDLLVVNGAVRTLEKLASQRDPYPFHQPNQLFRNLGRGRFEETTSQGGPGLSASEVSRGSAFGDIDNDGDTDALISNNNGPARLLLNQVGSRQHWLGLTLVDKRGRATGARATLWLKDGRRLLRRAHSDGSYASANDPRILFGLGSASAYQRIVVDWPDGSSEQWSDPPTGRYSILRQGEGRPVKP